MASRQYALTERLTPLAGAAAKPGGVNRQQALAPVSAEYRAKQDAYKAALAAKESTWAKLSEEDREAARIQHKKSVLGD